MKKLKSVMVIIGPDGTPRGIKFGVGGLQCGFRATRYVQARRKRVTEVDVAQLQTEVNRTVGLRGPRVDATWAPWWRAQAKAIVHVAILERRA